MKRVRIPKIDANIEEATIGRWLKAEGEPVRRKEPLVELITDKAVFELESPAAGVLRRIVAAEKSVLPVQYIIALIGDPDEPLPDVGPANGRLLDARRNGPAPTPAAPAAPDGASATPDIRATPSARRLARELGVDLAAVQAAAGPGRIGDDAVRAFAEGRRS